MEAPCTSVLMAQLSEAPKCSIFPTIDYVLGPRHERFFSKERGFPYLVGWKKKTKKTGKLWLGSVVMGVNLEGTRPVVLWSWPCGFLCTFTGDAITIVEDRSFLIYFTALNEEGRKLR